MGAMVEFDSRARNSRVSGEHAAQERVAANEALAVGGEREAISATDLFWGQRWRATRHSGFRRQTGCEHVHLSVTEAQRELPPFSILENDFR